MEKRGRIQRLDIGNRKRMLILAVCLSLLLSGSAVANAEEQASNRTVKAGVFYFDGYHMRDEDGNLSGYGVEFLNMLSRYSHLNFEFSGYDRSWEDMLVMLDNGEIDVVTTAGKTPDREEKYLFSLPIGRNSTILSIRSDNTSLFSGEYATYEGIRIGLVAGSSQNDRLEEFAKEKGFSYEAVEYTDSGLLTEALQNGDIDAILSSNLRKAEHEKTLDTIQTDYFYAIVRKDDAELLAEINYAIDQMNINEGDWSNELYFKYYGKVPSDFSFSEREQAYIQDVVTGKKKITVTSIGDRKPYSYVENGELKGIIPEFFAGVMEQAGLPYEIVVPEDRADYYALAEHDGVDIVIDWRQLQSKGDSRLDSGFCTDAYMNTGIARVIRKDFNGKVATVAVADVQGEISIEQDMTGNVRVLRYPTREDALKAVLNGEADATYVYTYTAQSFVDSDLSDSLKFDIVNSVQYDFRMYVRSSSDHELINILNKSIHQMPNDLLNQIITEYTAGMPENVSPAQYMRAHPGVLALAILVFAMGLGVIIALFLRARWSKKLLRATEHANKELEEQLAIVNTLSRDYLNIYTVNAKAVMSEL